ncbi:S8 family serine peptidase [Hymenobacter sediminicola]|uniref:S8 family serine peptidase n=1 Tax=Hymenobacter sediminicola TaxID=2761579 RepID=A0A7G7W7J3_9BACT|nr:S8 family serine peptidase [Hymenobacter sediminicola]QNH62336.1 S8 family serine peptidase [Hymenobacter sediminicola]
MKHLHSLGLAALLGLAPLLASAQPAQPAGRYALQLASGPVTPVPNGAEWLQQPATAPSDAWQGQVFRVLQFEQLPTAAQKAALAAAGVRLFDYLPRNAWTASLPATLSHQRLAGLGLRSVQPVAPTWKLAGDLARNVIPDHMRRGSLVEVNVQYYATITPSQAAQALRQREWQEAGKPMFDQQLRVLCRAADIARIAALPWVSAVEPATPPAEPENFRGRTDHRANAISTDYGAGRHYDGRGVTVGHGDDGRIGPHIDYQGRFDQSAAGASQGNHGDHVAGIIMGAGNMDPRVRGNATAAFNLYYSYPGNLNNTPTAYASTRRMRVTNSSYGDGNNAGYTSFTRTMDQQTRQRPYLLHVFSSGNSGTSDFGYGAGAGWGNITGGHKMGKNVMTVGNVLYTDALAGSSSRGPAKDGRIKPDVCAVGTSVTSTVDPNTYAVFTGTSMACPGVAGVTAQLVQAYRSLNSQQEAPTALLKAALMNTAEDLGNPGPDFRFGYGRVNALRAVRVLEQRTYLKDSLTTGQTKTHTIAVPAGKKQFRVMVYWHDYEAAVNSTSNLVNDLNMQVAAPNGTSYLPWVLDHRPTAAQLNSNAIRARDSINNVEQVTLDETPAGTYTVTVRGASVPQGPQTYYLVYSYIEDGVELTYPLGGEGFVPGEAEVLRWDAPAGTGTFALDYTTDNGATWLPISAAVAATARHFDWTVPAGVASGRVKVRVTRGSASSQSVVPLTISPLPGNLRLGYVCANTVKLQWDTLTTASAYVVYKLGAEYMDSVTTVTRTSVVLTGVGAGAEQWYSIQPIRASDGLRGRRTRALNQPALLNNCPGPPLIAFQASRTLVCPGVPITLTDRSQSQPTTWTWSITPSTGVTFVGGTTAASQNPQVQFSTPGTYSVTLLASNSYGPTTLTQSALITVTNGQALPLAQNFTTSTFPPAGWEVQNPSSNFTWQLSAQGVMGPDTLLRPVPMVEDYSDNVRGAEDYLVTPPLDLSGRPTGTNSLQLNFWVAYAAYSATYFDGIRVDVSTDCGATFQPTGYLKRGTALATVTGFQTSQWAPNSPADWRQETVDLSSMLAAGGPSRILVRFANINDYGNNVYLTNVRLRTAVVTGTAAARNANLGLVGAYPVPFSQELHVQLAPTSSGTATLVLLDALGRQVSREVLTLRTGVPQQHKLATGALPAGVYTLRLLTPAGSQQLKVVK